MCRGAPEFRSVQVVFKRPVLYLTPVPSYAPQRPEYPQFHAEYLFWDYTHPVSQKLDLLSLELPRNYCHGSELKHCIQQQ